MGSGYALGGAGGSMTKDDAIKQARDALKNLPGFLADVETAIDACDEALAQPSHPLTPVLRDDTEHGKAYYLASDVDALLERLAGGGKVMQEPLTDDQVKQATWETSQDLLAFAAENGIAAQGIDERVVAVGRAAIELAKGGMMEDQPERPMQTSAEKTLQRLGYTDHGGELWKPPLGSVPAWARPEQEPRREPTFWQVRIVKAHPKSEPEHWPDDLKLKYMAQELAEYRDANAAPAQHPVTPTPKEQGYVPLSDDGKSVFIDGFGEAPLAYPPMQPAPMPAAPAELLGNPEQLERRQLPTNCRHCGGPDDVICGGQCRRATDAFADADKVMHPVQEPETAVYIRKDQLQKAAQSAMLCEVTPEPRQDRIRIYTAPPKIETEAAHGITGGAA